MAILKVHLHELVSAFHNGGNATFYLDTKTGQVLMDYEGTMYDDEGVDIHEELVQTPQRFVEIDRIGHRETLRMMKDFIEREPSEIVRTKLREGLASQRPFQGFRNTLFDYPATRKRWYLHEQRCVEDMAETWLQDHHLNAKLVKPRKQRGKKDETA